MAWTGNSINSFAREFCCIFAVWTSWRKGLPIILLTTLGDWWGGLATYQQTQMKSIQPLVAFALQPGVPFRTSSSNSTIGSKYCVLPRQPLSRLGARSGRFVPHARGNTGGKAKSKSDHEVVFKDVCLLPKPGWSNVPRRTVKETLLSLYALEHLPCIRLGTFPFGLIPDGVMSRLLSSSWTPEKERPAAGRTLLGFESTLFGFVGRLLIPPTSLLMTLVILSADLSAMMSRLQKYSRIPAQSCLWNSRSMPLSIPIFANR